MILFSNTALANELSSDPAGLGYGADCVVNAVLLNTATRHKPVSSVARKDLKTLMLARGKLMGVLASSAQSALTIKMLFSDPDYETLDVHHPVSQALFGSLVADGLLNQADLDAIAMLASSPCNRCQELWDNKASVDWHEVADAMGYVILGPGQKLEYTEILAIQVGQIPDAKVFTEMVAKRYFTTTDEGKTWTITPSGQEFFDMVKNAKGVV